MRRFSLTHTPRKSLGINNTTNRTVIHEDTKATRNVRDKVFQKECIQKITNFLTENKYEGNIALSNASTKDFQNILRFLIAFIDANLSSKFEEDVLFLIKTFKYTYSNEITKSQLVSVTPHALPSLIAMLAWLTDIINEVEGFENKKSMDSAFLEYCCKDYLMFMESEESKTGDDEFLEAIKEMYENESDDIEKLKEEIEVLENTLKETKEDFVEAEKLEKKKTKIMEEMKDLCEYGEQIKPKIEKNKENIGNIYLRIKELQTKIDTLDKEKSRLNNIISEQEINMTDINALTEEKSLLNKQLEKLKNEREKYTKNNLQFDSQIQNIKSRISFLSAECCNIRRMNSDEFLQNISEHENALNCARNTISDAEMQLTVLEEKLNELKIAYNDMEKEFSRHENKLNEFSQMYAYKKEQFEKNYEESLLKMDQQINDMVKLKLTSDYALQNSERELNNMKIEVDTLKTKLSTEKDIIERNLVDLSNFIEVKEKVLFEIENEMHKLIKN